MKVNKQCESWSDGFITNQLIMIYSVFKKDKSGVSRRRFKITSFTMNVVYHNEIIELWFCFVIWFSAIINKRYSYGPGSLTRVLALRLCNFFLYSTQLSTKLIQLINVKMPTIFGILTFISMRNATAERLKARNFFICRYFSFYEQLKCCAQLSWAWRKFYYLRAWLMRWCFKKNIF